MKDKIAGVISQNEEKIHYDGKYEEVATLILDLIAKEGYVKKDDIFKIAGKSRPIKNKKGEITSVLMIDLRDLDKLGVEL